MSRPTSRTQLARPLDVALAGVYRDRGIDVPADARQVAALLLTLLVPPDRSPASVSTPQPSEEHS